MLRRIVIWSGLLLSILVMLLNLNQEIEGTYVFVHDGECHFLPFNQDTLILHDDGKVESKNFPSDALFVRKKLLFEDDIKIYNKDEYALLPVRGNVFSGRKLIVCLDEKGYYVKQ